MSPDNEVLTHDQRRAIEHTILVRERLEEQFESLEHQHLAASTGMWVFLATEVMFFGTLFVSFGIYRLLYGEAFEKASVKLNWFIGSVNTVVLLVSSLMIVLALHFAKLEKRKALVACLGLTALLGVTFLCFKGVEYYIDYAENLIPGWKFDPRRWVDEEGLSFEQTQQVQLFLGFYWVMTAFHALHVTIGVCAIGVIMVLAWRGHFSAAYYSPVDVMALYWHFVDIVWIFLLPMLYLLGTHTWQGLGW